jgi:hypothetical protein
LWDILV